MWPSSSWQVWQRSSRTSPLPLTTEVWHCWQRTPRPVNSLWTKSSPATSILSFGGPWQIRQSECSGSAPSLSGMKWQAKQTDSETLKCSPSSTWA